MRRSQYSEEQNSAILEGADAGKPIRELCREHDFTDQTYYRRWKAKYESLEVSEARRPKALKDENRRLRKLLAEAMLDSAALKDILGKTANARDAVAGPNANPYQFTGRENDGTGLYFYRARYYSPTFQRFIAQDPIGFMGGSASLYAYVRENPINSIDRLGLLPGGGPNAQYQNALRRQGLWVGRASSSALEDTQLQRLGSPSAELR